MIINRLRVIGNGAQDGTQELHAHRTAHGTVHRKFMLINWTFQLINITINWDKYSNALVLLCSIGGILSSNLMEISPMFCLALNPILRVL